MREDTYNSFQELTYHEKEGIDYQKIILDELWRNNRVTIIAPHGGKIEPHTSLIATDIAGTDYVLYKFEGIKTNQNFPILHITGTNFDDPDCLELLQETQTAIAIHGMDRNTHDILIGGLNSELIGLIEHQLSEHGFDASFDYDGILPGKSAENICNKTRSGKGMQLEINKSLRRFSVSYVIQVYFAYSQEAEMDTTALCKLVSVKVV